MTVSFTPKPYILIEVANCHGGSIDYLLSLIDEFAGLVNGYGMKFQPFYYDDIATRDYKWYEIYKELYFDRDQWRVIVGRAVKTKDVWLDLFDSYSLQILADNLPSIYGVKLQASVLENRRLLRQLTDSDLSAKPCLVNISGYELDEIERLLAAVGSSLPSSPLVLQVGFQGYPTEYRDAGLVKVEALRARYPAYDLCFADHVAGDSDEALLLPTLAVAKGCSYIEKHVMSSSLETRYDHFSALDRSRFDRMLGQLDLYLGSESAPFLPDKEFRYLADSIQVPIAERDLAPGTIPSLADDFVYKRSGQSGLLPQQIDELLSKRSMVASTVSAGETLKPQHFRKAVIGTVIACRVKSSRLPRKALQKLGGLTSVECCIRNALSFAEVNHTVLATSTHPDDAVLQDYLWSDQVGFFRGDPDDVIARYLAVAEAYRLDIIIRVTADCPYVSAEITRMLLDEHFRFGSDFTRSINAAVGTSAEVINVSALRKIKELAKTTELSEYMTYYFTNNLDVFRIRDVELPDDLVRDYRLTLDYEEDLVVFNHIQGYLDSEGMTPVLENIFSFLDANPQIANSNKHCTLKYKSDPGLIKELSEKTRLSVH